MNQYVHEKFTAEYKATIGADFLTKHLIVNEKALTIQVFQT
jgi:Ras-related protein Rab-7A